MLLLDTLIRILISLRFELIKSLISNFSYLVRNGNEIISHLFSKHFCVCPKDEIWVQ